MCDVCPYANHLYLQVRSICVSPNVGLFINLVHGFIATRPLLLHFGAPQFKVNRFAYLRTILYDNFHLQCKCNVMYVIS